MILPYEKLGIHAGIIVVDEKAFVSVKNPISLEDSDRKARDFLIEKLNHVNFGKQTYWLRCQQEQKLLPEILRIPHTTLIHEPHWPINDNRIVIVYANKESELSPVLPKILTDIIFGEYKCIVIISPEK